MISLEDWGRVFGYFADNVKATNPYSIVFIEPYGGAINAVAAKDSAFIHRGTYMDISWTASGRRAPVSRTTTRPRNGWTATWPS